MKEDEFAFHPTNNYGILTSYFYLSKEGKILHYALSHYIVQHRYYFADYSF